MNKEKSKDEKLITDFLEVCNQFENFSSSLTMPLYSDEPNLYEYFNLVKQQIQKVGFIISKLSPILKEGKRLHDRSLKDESFIPKIHNYLFEHREELSFFHEDFFIHSRILMDRLALLSSFLFKINKKEKMELVDSFSSYFKHENGQITPIIKDEISKKLPEELKSLLSETKWYIELIKKPRDQLVVHAKDAKHRIIGGVGFVSGGNFDFLDGLTFLQAYHMGIKNENFNNVPILKFLIPEITSFLSEYLKIIKNENEKTKIQTN